MPAGWLDATILPETCRGVIAAPHVARLPVRLLLRALGGKRAVHVQIPILWLLSRNEMSEAVELAAAILQGMPERGRNFWEKLRDVKDDKSNMIDEMLVKNLKLQDRDLLDSLCYENLFKRILALPGLEVQMRQYSERTLRAIEGEQHRRALSFKQEQQGH